MTEVIVISDSINNFTHVKDITKKLDLFSRKYAEHFISAHLNTTELLNFLEPFEKLNNIIFVTVSKNETLPAIVSCNTKHIVIYCPLDSTEKTLPNSDYCSILTVSNTTNCALAIERIIRFKEESICTGSEKE